MLNVFDYSLRNLKKKQAYAICLTTLLLVNACTQAVIQIAEISYTVNTEALLTGLGGLGLHLIFRAFQNTRTLKTEKQTYRP